MGWGRVKEFGVALAIIVGAVLARLSLDQVIPGRLPFITFFPAVALVAYYSSRETALLPSWSAGLQVSIGSTCQPSNTVGRTPS